MSSGFVIVCGGTGGHLTPGIAIAQQWQDNNVECDLIVSRKPIDQEISSQHPDLRFHAAPGRPFSFHPVKLVLFIGSLFSGLSYAFRKLRQIQPEAVVAFGGFTSVAFCLVAKLLRIPIFLHEANRVPGRSICMLSRLADRIYLPTGVRISGVSLLRQKDCGLPIRREVKHVKKDIVRAEMNLPRQSKLLVVIGGSQGATALNDWVKKYLKLLLADGISVYCVTGPRKIGEFESVIDQDVYGNRVEAKFFAFHNNISQLFSSADLVLSRAGAGTIAELNQCLCPAIFVPYTYAAGNHQLANARYQEMRGCGVLIEEKNVDHLYREVTELIFNDWLLTKMRDNLRRLDEVNAATYLVEDLEQYLKNEYTAGGYFSQSA